MTPLDPEVRAFLQTLLRALDTSIGRWTPASTQWRVNHAWQSLEVVLNSHDTTAAAVAETEYLYARLAEVERAQTTATESTAGERKP